MSGNHIVMDALRQMLRCEHCRAETALPTPCSLDTMLASIKTFSDPHENCHVRTRPGAFYVRTGENGAALKRDDQGLWWSWFPAGMPAHYHVAPVALEEAIERLRSLITQFKESKDADNASSARQANVALVTEGASS